MKPQSPVRILPFLLKIIASYGLCMSFMACPSKEKKDIQSHEEEVPTSYMTQDKKMGLSNLPDESAYLPYCQDSVDIPRFKKRFCAQRILSQQILERKPEWNSIYGVVYIQLSIEADGKISDFSLKNDFTGKNIGQSVVEEVKEILKDAQCLPAKQKGFKTKSNLVIPVYFGLHQLDEKILNQEY